MSRHLRTIAAIAAVALVTAGPAAAAPSTAILEFRAGSSALPGLGDRVAAEVAARTSRKVLGNDQARQRFGEGLDRAVVECAGESACIGAIGARLRVDEVLLVGISELGDVILTVQRVQSSDGAVTGRIAEALATDAAPSDADLLGYLERVLPAEDFVRFGTISIKVNVAGAEIWVGGKTRGHAPIEPLRVPAPSRYPIEIKKAGFATFRASVDVPPDAAVDVDAELVRPGTRGGPWYGKWWVVATAGVVVAGAVTTAVLLTRDRDAVPFTGRL